jgi:hypothetical protein
MLMYEGMKVGDKVNTGVWSDRYPGTVIEVNKTGKTIKVQTDDYEYDKSKGEAGKQMGHQNWVVVRDENGPITTYTWRKSKGRDVGYVAKGWAAKSGNQVQMGWRYYYDWSF